MRLIAVFFSFIILPGLWSAAQAADNQGNYAVWGLGRASCFQYTKARSAAEEHDYKIYLMGYLTAVNSQQPDTYRITGNTDINGVLEWLDDHCRHAGVESFERALGLMTEAMYEKRLRRPPR